MSKEIDCPEIGTTLKLYRPTYTKKGETKTSRTWWVRYRWEGELRFQNLKVKQYDAALSRLAEFRKKLAMKVAGVEDPFEEWRDLAIATHVEHWETTLRANGVTAKHLDERVGYVRAFVERFKVKKLGDLDVAKASAWFAELLSECETARYGKAGLSARSINKRRAGLVQFGKWLHDVRRIADNPFRTMKKLNERADRRHKRRGLTDAELMKLLKVAAARALEETHRNRFCAKIPGEKLALVRTIVYAWLNRGGPRENEARTLRVGDLDLTHGWAKISAEIVKTREARVVAIHAGLVPLFARLVEGAKPDALVFPEGSFPTLAKWKADLAAAGIAYEDERGFRADMHAGRKKMSTDLQRAGATVKDTAFLMGHSPDGKTTLAHYSDEAEQPELKQLVDALPLALPVLPDVPSTLSPEPKAKRARSTSKRKASAATNAQEPEKVVRKVVTSGGSLGDSKGLTSSLEGPNETRIYENDEGREPLQVAASSEYARQDSNLKPSAPEAGEGPMVSHATEQASEKPGKRLVRKVVTTQGDKKAPTLAAELLQRALEAEAAGDAKAARTFLGAYKAEKKRERLEREKKRDAEGGGKVLKLGG